MSYAGYLIILAASLWLGADRTSDLTPLQATLAALGGYLVGRARADA